MDKAGTPSTTFDPVRLISTHQEGVWRYLRALGCQPDQADDFTQETFLTVLQKPFQDYNQAATASYLRTVARNLFISHQRRAGRVKLVEDIQIFDVAWKELVRDDDGDELLTALRDCIAELTPRARKALHLRFAEKLARVDIGAALDITEHGAKNLMQRAKKQLKTCINGKIQQDEADA